MNPVKLFMVPAEKFVKVDRCVSVRNAAEIMRDHGIGSVFVSREGSLIGILSDTEVVMWRKNSIDDLRIKSGKMGCYRGFLNLLDRGHMALSLRRGLGKNRRCLTASGNFEFFKNRCEVISNCFIT